METYEQQILADFEEESLCSVREFPVSQRALPGSAEAIKMTVGSGRQCAKWLDQSDPLGAFSKILMESCHWGNSEEYCYVWERLDTRFGCSGFQLTPLGLIIDGTECSLWPTPTVQDGANNGGPSQYERNSLSLNATVGGSLNPRFCEELMGYPIDHTALKP